MANIIEENAQLKRMKALMGYGLTESKAPVYSSVEYTKKDANGNVYGIVREGTSYFIKKAKDANGQLVTENFNYIGGFRNRKDNMFESFAAAQKSLGQKLIQINEECTDKSKRVIAEAWDIDAAKEVVVEGTKKMQAEIARQKEIMRNASLIQESGSCTGGKCKQEFEAVKGKDTDKNSEAPKSEAQTGEEKVKDYNGKEIKGGAGAPFNIKPSVNESTTTPLTSRENPDYIDTSHGTEIGKNTGFGKPVENKTENAVAEENGGEAENTETPNEVNEDVALHNTDNQNSPKPGTDGPGDTAPFEEKANVSEAVEDLDSNVSDDELDLGGEGDELGGEGEPEGELGGEDPVAELEPENEPEGELGGEPEVAPEAGGDVESRLASLESKLDMLLDAIQDDKYDDEPLYNDEDGSDEGADKGADEGAGEGADEGADKGNGEDDDDEFEVIESRSYKKAMMKEDNTPNVWGKHPAFQKKVMTLPQNTNPKKDGQYDMNDSSVEGEQPYGQGIGSNAPFEINPKNIDTDAIVESVMKLLKKKLQ